ncbi:cell cycle checkpoint protein RAD17 [Melanotaenia boesemani]|uniref:cell cycle checkpoint protein RAD17 n=1 Tax=Melanotaenia boesemani TaxID=1250792 RepID=UPI001C05695A|nr:cell cycle checkpoint protein RAD17 [Melanotaenia boesemani]
MNQIPVRVKRWVDPSFTDIPEKGISLSGRKRSFRPEMKRPRKKGGEASTLPLWTDSTQPDPDEPWVERYSPRSQAELGVHRKKVEEVENWIRAHTDPSKGGILILTGPSGCGKTATLQVLSLQMNVRVQEWTNPSTLELHSSRQHDIWRTDDCSSQLAQFQEFLLRANKYNCLKMAGDGGATDGKLILVEDFPNQFYRQPSSLHYILRRFVTATRCPLVLIVSDSWSGDSNLRSLFPREIQEELNISCISFNPVAPTAMMKILSCISTLEAGKSCGKMQIPDQTQLETLCSGSSGDIRNAINSLQFLCGADTSIEKDLLWMKDKPRISLGRSVSRTKQRMKKAKQTKEDKDQQVVGGKDASLFLFRALGKLLHCKRESPGGSPRPGLPSHLMHHHREALTIDPEMVVEHSHMSGEIFNLYLHQNFLDFFSEMEDVDRASEYLSDADLLTADWTSRSIMREYGSSVATRGLLHSNSHQVSVGFRPLHKPSWLLVSRKVRENCSAAQVLFRRLCLTAVGLQTQMLPYLNKVSHTDHNQAQISFIQEVGQMSLRRYPDRMKLETLTDKDTGQLEEEKEEGGPGRTADGRLHCLLQPLTNQVVFKDDDLIIEEYTSD